MSNDVDALLIFCEGPHDTAFVRMVLKKLMDFHVAALKFSSMPAPFHLLFPQTVKKHSACDMSLDMAHKFFLPDTVMQKEDQIIFIYNSGGKTQYEKIRSLLSSYLPLFDDISTFSSGAEKIVQSIKYLFLYDIDADGVSAIAETLSAEFAQIGETNFIDHEWEDSGSSYGKTAHNKAFFAWGGSQEKGTLEDLLLPMVNSSARHRAHIDKTKDLLKDMFPWGTEAHDVKHATAEVEKFHKAVLTTVGQREKPGSSLNVILEQAGLITAEALAACEITKEFVLFIRNFLDLPHFEG